MIEGLRAVSVRVPDLALATEWYARALQLEPYVSEHDSVTFFIDGYLLTLKPGEPSSADGTVAYWGVDDLAGEYRRLVDIGSAPYLPVQDVDAVTTTAAVLDPFGNVFGIVERRDRAAARAREQRVAEKVAIRNVREVLDGLQRDERRKSGTARWVLVATGLCVALAGIMVWDLVERRPAGDAVQSFIARPPAR